MCLSQDVMVGRFGCDGWSFRLWWLVMSWLTICGHLHGSSTGVNCKPISKSGQRTCLSIEQFIEIMNEIMKSYMFFSFKLAVWIFKKKKRFSKLRFSSFRLPKIRFIKVWFFNRLFEITIFENSSIKKEANGSANDWHEFMGRNFVNATWRSSVNATRWTS